MFIDNNALEANPANLSERPQTLEDLKAFLRHCEGLTDTQRRDMISGVTSIGKYINAPLNTLPADGRQLRHKIEKLHHRNLGITKGRLDNVKSQARKALKLLTERCPKKQHNAAMTSDWQALRDCLPPNSKFVYSLSRFMRFCSNHEISPDAVNSQTLAQFLEQELEPAFLQGNPVQSAKQTAKTWNRAIKEIEGWPSQTITLEAHDALPSKVHARDILPASFFQDLDRFEKEMSRARLEESESGHLLTHSIKASTLALRVRCLKKYALELVEFGRDPKSIASLEDLANPELFRRWAEHLLDKKPCFTGGDISVAMALLGVAERYLALPEKALENIKATARVIRKKEQSGMTQKNKQRLLQFREPDQIRQLLTAPAEMLTSAFVRKTFRKEDANTAMIAATLAILIVAPIRRQNLLTIRFDQHITHQPDGNVILNFADGEVKNSEPIEVPVPSIFWRVVTAYIEKARPRLIASTSPFLFPQNQEPQFKYFSTLFASRLKKLRGLDINPHLLRHISAYIYLSTHPGDYETVRRLLGHKDIKTTVTYYCDNDVREAFKAYDQIILDLEKKPYA